VVVATRTTERCRSSEARALVLRSLTPRSVPIYWCAPRWWVQSTDVSKDPLANRRGKPALDSDGVVDLTSDTDCPPHRLRSAGTAARPAPRAEKPSGNPIIVDSDSELESPNSAAPRTIGTLQRGQLRAPPPHPAWPASQAPSSFTSPSKGISASLAKQAQDPVVPAGWSTRIKSDSAIHWAALRRPRSPHGCFGC
jgi:hypothetical protein